MFYQFKTIHIYIERMLYNSRPKISIKSQVNLPTRTLKILNTKTDKTKIDKEDLYDVQFKDLLEDEHLNLICIPVLHKTSSDNTANNL